MTLLVQCEMNYWLSKEHYLYSSYSKQQRDMIGDRANKLLMI